MKVILKEKPITHYTWDVLGDDLAAGNLTNVLKLSQSTFFDGKKHETKGAKPGNRTLEFEALSPGTGELILR
eukprot:CAMPEP_0170557912 /NCGR_PEP_ID=MMETSP0211-20121228/31250_1 /TAXON_ID=311385 /ORGANISM="Pseudokeronopsis sp., Strain OXSARD2" /LENGTH=71 /DNA_ID=CAMNT_0010869359 /DNA_START=59 /DNA_END=274 /DNA_ORIENTATION=-